MNRFLYLLVFCLVCVSLIEAQTAADYYLPPRTGNILTYHTLASSLNNGFWGARTTTERVSADDMVNGQTYFRYIGTETMDATPLEPSIFHVLWIRADDAGNILIGAFNPNGGEGLDSAIVLPGGQPLFSNHYLTVGYSYSFVPENYLQVDSVISNTETVTCPAGTFTNCLKISERHIDTAGTVIFEEFAWYARGIGKVQVTRTIPVRDVHTDQLISYSIMTGVAESPAVNRPEYVQLFQNYPNPFNPSSMIRFMLPSESHVRLTVSNAIGQQVQTLINGTRPAGESTIQFDGTGLPTGLYYYRLEAASLMEPAKIISETKKMLLVR